MGDKNVEGIIAGTRGDGLHCERFPHRLGVLIPISVLMGVLAVDILRTASRRHTRRGCLG